MLDRGPRLEPGHGRLDLGVIASPALIGGGARFDWRIARYASAFALAEVGYSPGLGRTDWMGVAGMRFEF